MSPNYLETSGQLQAAQIGSIKIQLHQLFYDDIDVHGSRALKQSRVGHLIH